MKKEFIIVQVGEEEKKEEHEIFSNLEEIVKKWGAKEIIKICNQKLVLSIKGKMKRGTSNLEEEKNLCFGALIPLINDKYISEETALEISGLEKG